MNRGQNRGHNVLLTKVKEDTHRLWYAQQTVSEKTLLSLLDNFITKSK